MRAHGRGWLGDDWRSPSGITTGVLLLALIAAGCLVIALPDSNERLFSLSPNHGPAASDALGSLVLLVGWGGLIARPVLRWRAMKEEMQQGVGAAMLFFSGLGLGLLLASVFHQLSWWWAVGAGILGVLQLYVIVLSLRVSRRAH